MKIYLKTFILTLKSIRGRIFLLLMLLAVTYFAVFSVRAIIDDKIKSGELKWTIAIANEDENKSTEKAVELLIKNEQIEDLFHVEFTDKSSGMSSVKSGNYIALVYLPNGFMDSILSGENVAPTIYLSNTNTFEKYMILSVIESFGELLKDAQGGIYATLDIMRDYGISTSDKILSINLDYISTATNIGKTFTYEKLKYVEGLPLELHFSLCLILFLIFNINSIFFRELNAKTDLEFIRLLGRTRKDYYLYYASKIAVIFLVNLAIIIAISVILKSRFSLAFLFSAVNSAVFITLIECLIYNIFGNLVSAIIANFSLSTLALFISGGIIPTTFLPKYITNLEGISPIFQVKELLSIGFISEIPAKQNILIAIFNLILAIILILITKKLWRKSLNE